MKVIIIIALTLFAYSSYGQTVTFNKRIQLGCVNTILSSIEATDSCYYASGFARDTINCLNSALFVKFDTLGNVLTHKIHYGAEAWSPDLRTTPDNDLAVTLFFLDSIGMHGAIYHYDDTGNLAQNNTIENPYTIGDFIRPDDMRITLDSGYILVNTVSPPPNSGADVQILKLDKNGNEDWQVIRATSNYGERFPCVYVEADSGYVVGYMQDNLNSTPMNYTIISKLEKIDSAGNSIWTYQSPSNEQVYGVNDLIKSKDGGWVVASAWGYEKLGANGTWSIPLRDCYVYKLDSARNFLWGRVFLSGLDDKAAFTKVIEMEDSSLVAFGIRNRWHTNLGDFVQHGRIVKLSSQGDSIWSREYEYLTTGAGIEHEIYDAERTYDGGFLVCGEANGNTLAGEPYQQGWLLKLDEHGCLVPGCHLSLGVLPGGVGGGELQFALTLYPNPTTDYLNVHYQAPKSNLGISSNKVGEELTFSVMDMQGRVLQTYRTADVSDKTYIVPVYDLVAGMYILEVRRDGELLKSEQFIKL